MPYSNELHPEKCFLIHEDSSWFCLNVDKGEETLPRKTRYVFPVEFDGRLRGLVASAATSLNNNRIVPSMFAELDTLLSLAKELK